MHYSVNCMLRAGMPFLLGGAVLLGCSDVPTAPLGETQASASLEAQVAGMKGSSGVGTTGRAQLHPENQSGVKGTVEFTDDGSTLTVHGTATGLVPGIPYASLIYDNDSVPGGPEACEPAIFDPSDPDFILTTMFVGFWTVDDQGNGTLWEENIVNEDGERVYVPLSKFKTISVRNLTINNGFGVEAVMACGEEATHGHQ